MDREVDGVREGIRRRREREAAEARVSREQLGRVREAIDKAAKMLRRDAPGGKYNG